VGSPIIFSMKTSLSGDLVLARELRMSEINLRHFIGKVVTLPDIRPVELIYNDDQLQKYIKPHLEFVYEIRFQPLPEPVTLGIYWMDSNRNPIRLLSTVYTPDLTIGKYSAKFDLEKTLGPANFSKTTRPTNAMYIGLVVDGINAESGVLEETNEENNVAFQYVPCNALLLDSLTNGVTSDRPTEMIVGFFPNYDFSLEYAKKACNALHFNFNNHIIGWDNLDVVAYLLRGVTYAPPGTIIDPNTNQPNKSYLPRVEADETVNPPIWYDESKNPEIVRLNAVELDRPTEDDPIYDPVHHAEGLIYYFSKSKNRLSQARPDSLPDDDLSYYRLEEPDSYRNFESGRNRLGEKNALIFSDRPMAAREVWGIRGTARHFQTSLTVVRELGTETFFDLRKRLSFKWSSNATIGPDDSEAGRVSAPVFDREPSLASQWHNQTQPEDVNQSTTVSPLDALFIINELNKGGIRNLVETVRSESSISHFLDTNNDNQLSPVDALLVINYLNQNGIGGEGESSSVRVHAVASSIARENVFSNEEFLIGLLDEEIRINRRLRK
jgi:Dockerin type I domain